MRRFHAKVFDDIVFGDCLTSCQYDGLLGKFDDEALQVVIDDANASSAMVIYQEHSSDGRTWQVRNTFVAPFNSGVTTPAAMSDTSGVPALAFVRYRLSTNTTVRARLYVTGRDAGAEVGPP